MMSRRPDSNSGGNGGGCWNDQGNKNNNDDDQQQLQKQKQRRRRLLLWSEIQKEWKYLAMGTSAMVVSSLSNQALPRLMGKFIDNSSSGSASSYHHRSSTSHQTSSSNSTTGQLTIVILGGGLASLLRTYTLNVAQNRITCRLRSTAFSNLVLSKNLEWFVDSSSSSINGSDINGNDGGNGNDGSSVNQRQEEDEEGETRTTTTTTKATTTASTTTSTTATTTTTMAGGTTTILTEDVPRMSKTCTTGLANVVRATSAICFSTYNMICINGSLFLTASLVVPVVGAAAMLLRKSIQRVSEQLADMTISSNAYLEERITNITMVRQSHREHDEIENYQQLLSTQHELSKRTALYNGSLMGFLFVATASALVLVVQTGSRYVHCGKITGGQLTSFSTYAFLLGLGTSGLVKGLGEAFQGLLAADRYYQLVALDDDDDKNHEENDNDEKNVIRNKKDGKKVNQKEEIEDRTTWSSRIENNVLDTEKKDGAAFVGAMNGSETKRKNGEKGQAESQKVDIDLDRVDAIVLKDVTFAYKKSFQAGEESSNKPVLQSISLKLRRGRVVAVVGKNGAGKSTLASLIAGLYQPNSGSIQVRPKDGGKSIDYKNLSKTSQSNLVQMIPQNTCLFNMSILDNVRYSHPQASEFEVRYALSEANCSDLLAKYSLDFCVGRNGHKLSGGERQRLALARCLLGNPAVLVMDEATNSLDAAGAAAVTEAVRDKSRAMLLITHNAKTLELADTVVVLEHGRIVEEGRYTDLKSIPESKLCQLMPSVRL